jgi:glycosyltransferase involved in cell wall biosynthesis
MPHVVCRERPGRVRCFAVLSERPLISVVIPTFGRPQHLAETLASVAAQTYRNIECIVVDDCSNPPVELPPTLGIDVQLYRHARNLGPGAARNTGLAHATGDLVLYLDDDDLITERRFEWAVRDIGDARMHACRTAKFDENGRVIDDQRVFKGDLRKTFNRARGPAMGQVVYLREDCLQFDTALRVAQDTEWWIRMADRAVFAWTDELGHLVRIHDDARAGVNPAVRYQCRLYSLRRHERMLKSDSLSLARIRRDVGSAALLADKRARAAWWAAKSLTARPSVLAVKIMARAAIPRHRHGAGDSHGGIG